MPKPGLIRFNEGGAAIEVEVWRLCADAFGRFVAAIPAPLGIGTIDLEDGSAAKGFVVESAGLDGAIDITPFGGWRSFVDHGKDQDKSAIARIPLRAAAARRQPEH